MKDNSQLIAKYCDKYGITREEAIQLIADDEAVDKMTSTKQIDSDMTDEQKKNAKKARIVGEKTVKSRPNYTFEKKNRKKDDEKEDFIAKLHEIVAEFTTNCEIVNTNNEISFNLGENSYSLKLTKHRKK